VTVAVRYMHDDYRLLPRFRRAPADFTVPRSTAPLFSTAEVVSKLPGDAWALRGIPAVSKESIGGAMIGTQPELALIGSQPGE